MIETMTWTATDLPDSCATLRVPIVDQGHYRIVGEVARGGVGRIQEAVDTRLQREVAIKELIHPDRNQARFIREAILTARLQHPAIVPVYEVGCFANDGPFIAMKLVRGKSLRDAIRERATVFERMELLNAVLAVVDAVAYAHSQRVIHRDLKPSNILIGNFGEVVVIDWGLAKHLDVGEVATHGVRSPGGETTQVGAVIGTPSYMPPEQALGRPVDERADVYSLGAVLSHLLTGAAPIVGDSAEAVLDKLRSTGPVAIAECVPQVPAELAVIVDKAMRYEAGERYRDASELAADLRRFQLGEVLSVQAQAPERDAAIEAAFEAELCDRTNDALQLLGIIAMLAIAAFGIVPRLYHGAFVARDVGPRAAAVLGLAVIWALGATSLGRRWSQQLAVVFVLIVGTFFVVVNIAERNVIGWFTSSMLTGFLGCMMLPLTPRRVLIAVGPLLALSAVEGVLSGLRPLGVQFILQVSLVATGALVAWMGARIGFRLRRAEFYSRYRLRRANERLARADGRMRIGGER